MSFSRKKNNGFTITEILIVTLIFSLMADDGQIKDPLLHPKSVQFYNKAYVAHNDPRNPLISPVFGNLRGLPPLLVHAGEDEILRDDAARIASLAKSVDVDVRLEIYPRMWHVWQLNLSLPQAIQSLDDITQFLKVHLGFVTQ